MKNTQFGLIFLAFWAGVLRRIVRRIHRLIGWLAYEEKRFAFFLKRFLEVESRIKGVPRKFLFLYRWLRYAIHHYHLLPSWVKVAKILLIAGLVYGIYYAEKVEVQQKEETLYEQLYSHYYEQFLKEHKDPEEAKHYAEIWAKKYAEYYASPAYLEVLRTTTLPKPKGKPKSIPANPNAKKKTPPTSLKSMKMNRTGIDLIKHFEGLSLTPYLDTNGMYSIGYGHLMQSKERYTRITENKAEQLLKKDLKIAEQMIKRYTKVSLDSNQFSALVSLVYNIGGNRYRRSTLLKRLNQGNYAAAGRQFKRWDKVNKKSLKGLTRRRHAEYLLFKGEWSKPKKK